MSRFGKVSLARRIHFSSGHRYYSPQLSEEENRRVFGSCYTEHGHGHNYILEAFVSGTIDPVTGMILNLADLDKILKVVTDPLDHHHLNFDIPYFKDIVPTTENLARYLHEKLTLELKAYPGVHLEKIRLFEGDDLWVDYQ